jgi:hypothetical protein
MPKPQNFILKHNLRERTDCHSVPVFCFNGNGEKKRNFEAVNGGKFIKLSNYIKFGSWWWVAQTAEFSAIMELRLMLKGFMVLPVLIQFCQICCNHPGDGYYQSDFHKPKPTRFSILGKTSRTGCASWYALFGC